MRRFFAFYFALLLSACGQVESSAQDPAAQDLSVQEKPSQYELQPVSAKPELTIKCVGVRKQGGAILCETLPNAVVEIGGIKTKSDANGMVILGFDRDTPKEESIIVTAQDGRIARVPSLIELRKFGVQRIDGLPPSQVSTFTEKQLARIRASSARKKKGFKSRQQTMWLKDGFTYPLKEFVKTSPFGNQRILNGVPKRPHYGVDIAAPVGTPIYAPADGVVSLADDDLYFEGAMVLLDHGQGLISMYLHMDDISVTPGQAVKRGDKLGEVGAKGRATGPHLCWRLKWRNRHLDPELLTEWPHEH